VTITEQLQRVVTLSQLATPGPWVLDHGGNLDIPRTAENRIFIHLSRERFPALARALLVLWPALEELRMAQRSEAHCGTLGVPGRVLTAFEAARRELAQIEGEK